jgi:hypothetical protein
MNIAQAKEIDLNAFLAGLGFVPVKNDTSGTWYCSPFRDEKTASFKVSQDGKAWIDFAESPTGNNARAKKFASGSIIDFALSYWQLQSNDIRTALSHIRECQAGTAPARIQTKTKENQTQESQVSSLILHDVNDFNVWTGQGRGRTFSPQARYLEQRGLDPSKCAEWLKVVKFSSSKTPKKSWYAVGFPNIAGGYELRAKFGETNFKGVIGAKDISFIKPKNSPPRLFVFEGFPDFLTALHIFPPTIDPKKEAFLILNSAALIERGKAIIEQNQFKKLIVWSQNDKAGLDMAEQLYQFGSDTELIVGSMHHHYEGFKDLNEYWTATSKKSLSIEFYNDMEIKPTVTPTNAPKL